ncbi:hypothetical protein ES705_22243 [subsurface metagenome]
MAYFGYRRKALFNKGFSEVERRGRIHPTRSVILAPLSVIPAKAGIHRMGGMERRGDNNYR